MLHKFLQLLLSAFCGQGVHCDELKVVWDPLWWDCIDTLMSHGVYLKWNEGVKSWTLWCCPPFPLPVPITFFALYSLHWWAQARQTQLHISPKAQMQQQFCWPAHMYNEYYLIKCVLLLREFKQFLKAPQVSHEPHVRCCLVWFIGLLYINFDPIFKTSFCINASSQLEMID